MTKKDLFLELAKPDRNGVSRWVNVKEFTGKYKDLQLGNGGSWCRKESSLAKQYMVEFDKELTSGNGIDAIRLNGFNNNNHSQHIRADNNYLIFNHWVKLLMMQKDNIAKTVRALIYDMMLQNLDIQYLFIKVQNITMIQINALVAFGMTQ